MDRLYSTPPVGYPRSRGGRLVGSFFVALQFLTRFPVPVPRAMTLDDLGRSIGWFPAVGAFLGLFLAAADSTGRLIFDPPVVDALLVTALAAATGALHLDGLVDTFDGLSAPTPEARLAAMRKAAAGPLGAVAACSTMLATYAVLSAFDSPSRAAALVLAPTAGRTSILVAYHLYPYARPEVGVSAALKAGATAPRTLAGLAFAAAVSAVVGGAGGLALLGASLVLMVAVAHLALSRIPGLTGDVHGAICEITQLSALGLAPFALRI